VNDTNEAFVRVAESASKVGELVGEISTASKEQAEGIEQINRAVIEMDKVVQQNAAGAEESASSAAEMDNQAEKMNHYVDDLVAIVGVNRRSQASKPSEQPPVQEASKIGKHPSEPAASAPRRKKPTPEELIPLEEDDFQDF
jgi:methyl-accepting chemotaxis protein